MGIFFNMNDITESVVCNYDYDNMDIVEEEGYLYTLRIYPIILKKMIKAKQFDYNYLKNEHMPKLVGKCRTVNDVKYLKKDRNMARSQLAALLKNVQIYERDPQNSFKLLGSSFRKAIDKGELNSKIIKDYMHFIDVDYLKMLNEKEKEIKNK